MDARRISGCLIRGCMAALLCVIGGEKGVKGAFDFCTKMNHPERRQHLGGWIWSDFWK